MISFDQIWQRLVAAVRRAHAAEATPVAPPGFAVRVVANWMELRREAADFIWGWLAVRGLAVAFVVTVVSVLAVWPLVSGQSGGDEFVALSDPLVVAELLP